jgi:DNA-binding MarR family transcriptional regulator
MHNLNQLEKDVLLFLLIQEKKGIKSVKFKDISDKTKKSDKEISESLKNLLKESLINKEEFGIFSLYSLTEKGREKAKEIREERREEIKEAIIKYFMEDKKFEKLVFIMNKDYMKFPIFLRFKNLRYDIYKLLKEYIVHFYIEPLEKIEFMYEEECIENIKDFWIREDYLKEGNFLIEKILKKIENDKEIKKGIKLNVLEYIKELFEENKLKIFQEFHEYSKNFDTWIKMNIKISTISKVLMGGFNGMISSYFALYVSSAISMLTGYFFLPRIGVLPPIDLTFSDFSYLLFAASISLSLAIGIIYAFYYERIKKILSQYIRYIFIVSFSLFLLYLLIYLIYFYFFPNVKFMTMTMYMLLFYLLYNLLCNCTIVTLWNIIVKKLFYLEFHILKIIKEVPSIIKWLSEYINRIIEALKVTRGKLSVVTSLFY